MDKAPGVTWTILAKESGSLVLQQFSLDELAAARHETRIKIVEDSFTEAMHQYRYFGGLRAAVSYLPALIMISITVFVTERWFGIFGDNAYVFGWDVGIKIWMIVSFCFGLTLFLIFITQLSFQRRQFSSRILAEKCHLMLTKDNHKISSVESYFYLMRHLHNNRDKNDNIKRFRPDISSLSLAIFFGIILSVYVIVVGSQLHYSTASGEDQAGSAEAEAPPPAPTPAGE